MPYKLTSRICPGCNVERRYTISQVTCPGCPGLKKKLSPSEREEYLRKEIKRLSKENSSLREWRGHLQEMASTVTAAIAAEPPISFEELRPRKPDNRLPFTAVLKLSDWHTGEIISPSETGGFGGYNWKIECRRMATITDKFKRWVETHRSNFSVPELVVLAEGDFVSGDIHHELSITNEFPVPVQIAKAGKLLGTTVLSLAEMFKKVRLVEIGGDNHGRYTRKPQYKQKALNNATFLVYTIANEMLSGQSNVTVELHDSFQVRVDIAGKYFLCEHGDNIKAHMGIPYYGMRRYKGREAMRRMNNDLGVDYFSCGHWHVPGIIEGNILVNGALTGMSEYDQRFDPSPPSQVSFMVSPKYGIFDWIPWRCE